MPRPTSRAFVAFLLVAAVACSDTPTSPSEAHDQRIVPGQTVKVQFDSGGPTPYLYFMAAAESAYAVEVTPQVGGATIGVTDSATGTMLLSGYLSIFPATPAAQRTSPVFVMPGGGTVAIQFFSTVDYPGGYVDVKVHTVDPAPEHVPAAITPGDTVSGESLDGALDIDRFTFTGKAGEYLEPVLHLPGAKDPVPAACLRILSPSGTTVGGTIASPGDTLAGSWDHSRTLLPVTGVYQVWVGNRWNGCLFPAPQFYNGPYTFTLTPIDSNPESTGASVAVGDTVSGESIGGPGDFDRYTIHGTPGALVEIRVRRADAGRDTLEYLIGGAAPRALTPADTAYGASPTGRIAIPDSGKLSLTFRGRTDGPTGDTGAYTFIAYGIDTLPETHAAAIALGDTIADEAIDPDGDIDRFTFTAAQGGFASFTFRTSLGVNGDPLQFRLLAPDGSTLAGPYDHPTPDTTTVRTGRVALPASGTYALRVASEYNGQGPAHRAYLIRTTAILPAPETLPDTFTFGDTLTGESLDEPGDVDRFRVHVTQTFGAIFGFHVDGAAIGTALARASLVDSATGEIVASLLVAKGGTQTTPSAYGLAPGTYYIEVADQGGAQDSLVGHYEVTTGGSGLGPEIAPDTVHLGDTVTTETISPVGDIDRFAFLGTAHQSVLVSLTGTGTPGDSVHLLFYPKNQPPILYLNAPGGGTNLGDQTSARLDLPATMAYEFDLRGDQTGPYAFSIVPYPTTPEHVADTLVLGDTLVGESIDTPGDIDRFTLTATPGAMVNVSYSADAGPGSFLIVIRDPSVDTAVMVLSGTNPGQPSAPFTIPASGKLSFTVAEVNANDQTCHDAGCTGFYQYTGAYRMVVTPLDSAPEIASATLVLGDTVKTEALEPIGDIDNFYYTGAAGDTVSGVLTGTFGVSDATGMRLHVIDPTTDTLIGSTAVGWGETNSTGPIVLPHDGTYRFQVLGNDVTRDHGTYWLLVRSGP